MKMMTERETLLWNEACKHIKIFCKVNNMVAPKIILSDNNPRRAEGVYRCGTSEIKVFPGACKPTKIIQRGYLNNPYWVEDDSIFGAAVHEFAHYVHFIYLNHKAVPAFAKKAVSLYGNTSRDEDFAEMVRVFIANPDLLKSIDIDRYNFLTQVCGLKPIKSVSWEKIFNMKKVPVAYYKAATEKSC